MAENKSNLNIRKFVIDTQKTGKHLCFFCAQEIFQQNERKMHDEDEDYEEKLLKSQ